MPNSASGTLSVVDADTGSWSISTSTPAATGGSARPAARADLGQRRRLPADDREPRLVRSDAGRSVGPGGATFQQETGGAVMPPSPRTASQTFRPVKGDGTLLTAPPYEAVFLPQDTSSLLSAPPSGAQPLPLQPQPLQMCGDSAGAVDPVGWPAQAGPKSWYVLVTYPSCDLITVVALPERPDRELGDARSTSDQRRQEERHAGRRRDVARLLERRLRRAGTSPRRPAPPRTPALRSDAAGTVERTAAAQPEAGVSDAAASPPTPEAVSGMARRYRRIRRRRRSTGNRRGPGQGGSLGSAVRDATGGAPGGATLGQPVSRRPLCRPGPISPSGIAILPDGSRAYVVAGERVVRRLGRPDQQRADIAGQCHLPARGGARLDARAPERRIRIRINMTSTWAAGVFVGADTGDSTASRWRDRRASPALDLEPQDTSTPSRETARCGSFRSRTRAPRRSARPTPIRCTCAPGTSASSACIPVDPAHRRPFSVGPGIHLPVAADRRGRGRHPERIRRQHQRADASTAPTPG